MRGSFTTRLVLVFAAWFLAGGINLCAQTLDPEAQSRSGSSPLPSIDDLEARLRKAEEAGTPDDAATAQLIATYRETISLLEQKSKNEALTKSFADALENAPRETAEAKAQLEALGEPGEEDGTVPLPESLRHEALADEIAERLAAARATALEIRKTLGEISSRYSALQTRPRGVRERLVEVRKLISGAETRLADLSAGTDAVDADHAARLFAQVEAASGRAELAMLEQEQLSYDVRLGLLKAQLDLNQRLAAEADALVVAIQAMADRRLSRDVIQVAMTAKEAQAEAEGKHPVVKAYAESIVTLSNRFKEIAGANQSARNDASLTGQALDVLARDFDRLKTYFAIGGTHKAWGEILVDQKQRLPPIRIERSKLRDMGDALAATRLEAFRIEDLDSEEPEAAAIEFLRQYQGPLTEEERTGALPILVSLAEKRRGLLKQLRGEYRRLLGELEDLDLAQQRYVEELAEVGDYLNEKQVWVRSSPPLGVETLTQLPDALKWLAGAARLGKLGSALKQIGVSAPTLTGFACALFVLLLALRPRLKRVLTALSQRTRRISTDEYALTVRALLITIVLAAPFPMITAFVGWQLHGVAADSDWLRGLGRGLVFAAYVLFVLCFARELCRSNGLAEGHFRWPSGPLKNFRENITWLYLVQAAAAVVIILTLSEKSTIHLGSIGRLAIMALTACMAVFLQRVLSAKSGVFSTLIEANARRHIFRAHKLWSALLVSFPVVLFFSAAAGYTMTASLLTQYFVITLELIGAGLVVYALILRWFSIRERKLVLERRLKERREHAAAAAAGGEDQQATPGVEGGFNGIDDATIDFELVGAQTRRILRFLVMIGTAVAVWIAWADVVPALRALDTVIAFGKVSLAQLVFAITILVFTVTTARNLPGILEIALLQHLPIDAGLRNTITTLSRYIVVALGIFFLLEALGLEWSSFGWIAAALSVGLGFGLQEIVANFVCGMILLFERPMRIGDIVTVADTTGTVSRIQIRATTITNWDRQELVVPNKEFVTGRFLNWTLTNPISRVVLTVGVAYGSDTARARALLKQILENQEHILDDPAPIITFEKFGDSTLDFTVRAYLPNLENRLATIDDLHDTIHRRFGEEGIEIAFPQRDLHLRSVDPSAGLRPVKGKKTPPSQ